MNGPELRARRKQLKLTQDELAERFGVSRITIIRWEAEKGNLPDYLQLALKQLESEQSS